MAFENRYSAVDRLLHRLAFSTRKAQIALADVEDVIGADHEFPAGIGADAQPSGEDDASVVQLARRRADHRPSVLLPAPAGLQDDTADNCASQSNLLVLAERVGDHRFRATEIADFDAPDGPLGGHPHGLARANLPCVARHCAAPRRSRCTSRRKASRRSASSPGWLIATM